MFMRSVVSLLHSALLTKLKGIEFIGDEVRDNTQNRQDLLIRSILGCIGYSCFVFATSQLPIGITMIVYNMGPFWASLLGWAVNKDSLTSFEFVCMVLSFGGIALVSLS
jgi:drug/metabolite transporter (DMT)-like permease